MTSTSGLVVLDVCGLACWSCDEAGGSAEGRALSLTCSPLPLDGRSGCGVFGRRAATAADLSRLEAHW